MPAGAVFDSMELTNEPSFYHRGILQTMQHGDWQMPMTTWPVRFDGAPAPIKPAPLLGEHTTEALGDWLGLGAGEVEALRATASSEPPSRRPPAAGRRARRGPATGFPGEPGRGGVDAAAEAAGERFGLGRYLEIDADENAALRVRQVKLDGSKRRSSSHIRIAAIVAEKFLRLQPHLHGAHIPAPAGS